eukprot:CAMPEP_0183398110 /NCGR_PEP_ID=MMETSP0370-20130417/11044_1 /TAXON_ID=268820 /ORGANISM="Peridinium aciculiferum, Strain PAER-2" /LENGTH=60 /DNA_ID=CAMNT_0025579089 /DNA_START=87 /DNA_END=265 /DNA_ORIENTATION=-
MPEDEVPLRPMPKRAVALLHQDACGGSGLRDFCHGSSLRLPPPLTDGGCLRNEPILAKMA